MQNVRMLGMDNETGSVGWIMGPTNEKRMACNPIDNWIWQICGEYSIKVAIFDCKPWSLWVRARALYVIYI